MDSISWTLTSNGRWTLLKDWNLSKNHVDDWLKKTVLHLRSWYKTNMDDLKKLQTLEKNDVEAFIVSFKVCNVFFHLL